MNGFLDISKRSILWLFWAYLAQFYTNFTFSNKINQCQKKQIQRKELTDWPTNGQTWIYRIIMACRLLTKYSIFRNYPKSSFWGKFCSLFTLCWANNFPPKIRLCHFCTFMRHYKISGKLIRQFMEYSYTWRGKLQP